MPRNRQRQLNAFPRRLEALELRLQGVGYVQIATLLGFHDSSHAHKAVMAALKATLQEPADEVRRMEIERLDRMLKALAERIDIGDEKSIDTALKIAKRRADLLGLDAPVKSQVATVDEVRIVWGDGKPQTPQTQAGGWQRPPLSSRAVVKRRVLRALRVQGQGHGQDADDPAA